jgi:hypothetical protein
MALQTLKRHLFRFLTRKENDLTHAAALSSLSAPRIIKQKTHRRLNWEADRRLSICAHSVQRAAGVLLSGRFAVFSIWELWLLGYGLPRLHGVSETEPMHQSRRSSLFREQRGLSRKILSSLSLCRLPAAARSRGQFYFVPPI